MRKSLPPMPKRPSWTPMVDMTFLMLVFFISTTKFVQYEGSVDANLPKDRGNPSSGAEIVKLDFLIFVADPGALLDTGIGRGPASLEYQGRRIRLEVGSKKFYFDPVHLENPRYPVPGLATFLKSFQKDMKYTPISIDARKGVTYGDVMPLFDYLTRMAPREISFAGTFEND